MTTLSDKLTRGTVPLSNLPERTVWVDENVLQIVATSGGGANNPTAVPFAKARVTKDSNGVYHLEAELSLTRTAGTSINFKMAGVSVDNSGTLEHTFQITNDNGGGAPLYARILNDEFQALTFSTTTTGYAASISVVLDAKPSWFDANREAGFSINAQVEAFDGVSNGLMTTPTGLSDTAATMLGLKTYSHGTTYNGGNAPTITVGGATLNSVFDSKFIPYQVQDGSWRLKFNFAFDNTTSTTNCGAIVAGVTAKNSSNFVQSICLVQQRAAANTTTGYILPNTSEFTCYSSTTDALWTLSGDIALESKPNWAY